MASTSKVTVHRVYVPTVGEIIAIVGAQIDPTRRPVFCMSVQFTQSQSEAPLQDTLEVQSSSFSLPRIGENDEAAVAGAHEVTLRRAHERVMDKAWSVAKYPVPDFPEVGEEALRGIPLFAARDLRRVDPDNFCAVGKVYEMVSGLLNSGGRASPLSPRF